MAAISAAGCTTEKSPEKPGPSSFVPLGAWDSKRHDTVSAKTASAE